MKHGERGLDSRVQNASPFCGQRQRRDWMIGKPKQPQEGNYGSDGAKSGFYWTVGMGVPLKIRTVEDERDLSKQGNKVT